MRVRPIVTIDGPSGAGKTTVVSMILRLFDPDSGCVTLDGADIRSYKLESLRDKIAVVLQEPFLLPMTIAENIAYARPNAPREAVMAAAEIPGGFVPKPASTACRRTNSSQRTGMSSLRSRRAGSLMVTTFRRW